MAHFFCCSFPLSFVPFSACITLYHVASRCISLPLPCSTHYRDLNPTTTTTTTITTSTTQRGTYCSVNSGLCMYTYIYILVDSGIYTMIHLVQRCGFAGWYVANLDSLAPNTCSHTRYISTYSPVQHIHMLRVGLFGDRLWSQSRIWHSVAWFVGRSAYQQLGAKHLFAYNTYK